MNDDKSETSVREYVPWEQHHENIFIDWADKASCYKWLHTKSNIKYSKKRNMYTIPVIVLSTLTGTANFALERVPLEYRSECSIIIGSVNILAGIITTVSQFFKINELSEAHNISSISWDKFHRSIRIELIKSPEERIDVTYFMKTCRDEFDRLMETCPAIDNDIINEFKIKLTTGGDKTEMSRKLKNFNKLIKPDIFDELISLKDTVYIRSEIKIDILDRDRITQEEIEKKKHMSRVKLVNNFVEVFKQKYSRKPSIDEILSNLTDIKTLELRIILDEIEING
tara:strand:- start:6404 stop:7255 length:852 start_codon:yes stop_codon:yes gene_type:complete